MAINLDPDVHDSTGEVMEITNLEVKEVSLVKSPAVPLAKFLIVKEIDEADTVPAGDSDAPPEPEPVDEPTSPDETIEKAFGNTGHVLVCHRKPSELEMVTLIKGLEGAQDVKPGWIIHLPIGMEVVKTAITKEPVIENHLMVTPTVSDETKAELQVCLKDLVGLSGQMKPNAKKLLSKVCLYHGIEGPEDLDSDGSDPVDEVVGLLERIAGIAATLKPVSATPETQPKTNKELDVEPVKKEVVVVTEKPFLTRLADLLHKQNEHRVFEEQLAVMKEMKLQLKAISDERDDVRRTLRSALGKDPDDI